MATPVLVPLRQEKPVPNKRGKNQVRKYKFIKGRCQKYQNEY